VFYMLLIHADESIWTNHTEEQQADVMRIHEELQRHLEKTDQYRGCGGLAPTTAATTLRREGGRSILTDGPYAETKEQFGGYYVVEVEHLDDAIAIAERLPTAANATIELRPIQDFRR
jgi:hypothetical protein